MFILENVPSAIENNVYSAVFFLLISSLIVLWLENMLDMISIFLNLLRLFFVAQHVIDPGECSMCTWKECVFCCFWIECSIYVIKSFCSNVSFKASVSLLICCLDDLSIDVSGVLKFPTIIVLLSISPFMSVNICFMYLVAPMLGHIYLQWLYLLLGLILWSLCSVLLCFL